MSEKDRVCTESIAKALNALEAARGTEYVNGLLDGIGIGTTPGEGAAAMADLKAKPTGNE